MSTTVLVLLLLAIAAALVIVLLLANAARGRRLNQDIPPAMRPGYSDEQLEKGVLERTMGWGLVVTVAFAIFLPVYWLREPIRQTEVTEDAFLAAYAQGEELYVANCAECHGADATGGATASTYDPDDSWPAPNLTTIVSRYENAPLDDVRDYVRNTIARGRPGTPMPTWGARFGGPLTDEQVEKITQWILANQVPAEEELADAVGLTGEELFETNCVRCHGDEGRGFIGPTLVGVFERHSPETILGILENGVYLANGVSMPPWQEAWMYPDARYSDTALRRIIGYLAEIQPRDIPEEAKDYVTPYQGEPRDENPAEGEQVPPSPDDPADTDAEA